MAVDKAGRRQVAAAVDPASRPAPSGPAARAGADPSPTATIRSPSITRCPSRYSVPAASTVAIAQPSMTVRIVTSATLGKALARQPDGVEDLLVARAPAQVARQRLADLRVARARVSPQQIVAGHDQPGRAEPALHTARLDERPLYLVQAITVSARDPLDGHDIASLRLRGEHEARADDLAVEVDRARSALALLACVLRSGEIEMLAQRVEQALALPHAVHLAALAVDGQRQAHRYASQAQVSVRRPSTPSAWCR